MALGNANDVSGGLEEKKAWLWEALKRENKATLLDNFNFSERERRW